MWALMWQSFIFRVSMSGFYSQTREGFKHNMVPQLLGKELIQVSLKPQKPDGTGTRLKKDEPRQLGQFKAKKWRRVPTNLP